MIRTGEVVWYATGRFYVGTDHSIQDVGYFVHLQGIEGPFFANDVLSESAAHFTFASEPFTAANFSNASLNLGLDTVGAFSLYLQNEPQGTFDDPRSFAQGECIATFERVSVVVGTTIGSAVTVNAFSAKLTWSREFTFNGLEYDFAQLLPYGMTQWGTASPEPVTPPPDGFTTVVPFVGSAIRIG